jgi:hypothetical protein
MVLLQRAPAAIAPRRLPNRRARLSPGGRFGASPEGESDSALGVRPPAPVASSHPASVHRANPLLAGELGVGGGGGGI